MKHLRSAPRNACAGLFLLMLSVSGVASPLSSGTYCKGKLALAIRRLMHASGGWPYPLEMSKTKAASWVGLFSQEEISARSLRPLVLAARANGLAPLWTQVRSARNWTAPGPAPAPILAYENALSGIPSGKDGVYGVAYGHVVSAFLPESLLSQSLRTSPWLYKALSIHPSPQTWLWGVFVPQSATIPREHELVGILKNLYTNPQAERLLHELGADWFRSEVRP